MYKLKFLELESEWTYFTGFAVQEIKDNDEAKLLGRFRLKNVLDGVRASLLLEKILLFVFLHHENLSEIQSAEKMITLLAEIGLPAPLLNKVESVMNLEENLDDMVVSGIKVFHKEEVASLEVISLFEKPYYEVQNLLWSLTEHEVSKELLLLGTFIVSNENSKAKYEELESLSESLIKNEELFHGVERKKFILLREYIFLLKVLYSIKISNLNRITADLLLEKYFNSLTLVRLGFSEKKSVKRSTIRELKSIEVGLRRSKKEGYASLPLSIILVIGIFISQIADFASTRAGIISGVEEGNFIMHNLLEGRGMVDFLLLKLGAAFFLSWYFWRRVVSSLIIILIFSLVSISNILIVTFNYEMMNLW